MKKKILKYMVTIVVVLIGIFAFGNVQAKSYRITDMDIQATILEDGSVAVKQELTYNFNGEYNGIYIDIPDTLDTKEYDRFRKQTTALRDSLYNATSVDITHVSEIRGGTKQTYEKVISSSNGKRGVYTIETTNGIKRIKVYSPANNTKKTFQVEFTLRNLCVKHNDIGELYYNFIGGGWQTTIGNLNIDIHLPNNTSSDDLKIFGHGPYNGTCQIVSPTQVNLSVTNVKPGQYVAARVLFDNKNIINTTKTSGINGQSIVMQDEENIYHNIEKKENFTKKILIMAGILLVYWIILIFVFEKDKKYPVQQTDEEELMKKYNPLLAGCIKESRTVLARDIIAILMNLIPKKIVNLQVTPTTQGKDGYIYKLEKVPENEEKMDEIEKYIYNWFFENSNSKNLVERLKDMPKEKNVNQKFKTLNEMAREMLQSFGANRQMPQSIRIFNTLLLGLCIVLILIHIQFNGLNICTAEGISFGLENIFYIVLIFFPMLMTLIYIPLKILSIVRHGINKVTKRFSGKKIVSTTVAIVVLDLIIILITNFLAPNSYLIVDEILLGMALIIVLTDNLMLKNLPIMIEDFSRINQMADKIENTLMNERNVEEVFLWEQYLAYAVSFGTAKKISKKIKDILLDDDLMKLVESKDFYDFLVSDYYMFYHYSSLDHIFLKNYYKSIGKVWKSYANSSGGGFSGGSGGGFSRWRWIFTAVEVAGGGGGAF